MSKILKASCVGNVVKVEDFVIPDADILSEGVGESDGLVFLEDDEATYLTSNASDIKQSLNSIQSALTTIATTLTSIGAAMTGPTTAPPPTLATDVAQITTKILEITTLMETLK